MGFWIIATVVIGAPTVWGLFLLLTPGSLPFLEGGSPLLGLLRIFRKLAGVMLLGMAAFGISIVTSNKHESADLAGNTNDTAICAEVMAETDELPFGGEAPDLTEDSTPTDSENDMIGTHIQTQSQEGRTVSETWLDGESQEVKFSEVVDLIIRVGELNVRYEPGIFDGITVQTTDVQGYWGNVTPELILRRELSRSDFELVPRDVQSTNSLPAFAIKKKLDVISIQPLSEIDTNLLVQIKAAVIKIRPNAKLTLLESRSLPEAAYYEPRNRYRAPKLLADLEASKPSACTKLIAITTNDISMTKGAEYDYGIMGASAIGGDTVVVSTFRVRYGNPSDELFHRRLWAIAAHELGHTYGIGHCPITGCLMEDMKGRIATVDNGSWDFCESCKKHLGIENESN